jgi:zinc protease
MGAMIVVIGTIMGKLTDKQIEGYDFMANVLDIDQSGVIKKVLPNGMTVLVREVRTIPRVSIQVWYGVGSRDEKDKERGSAHLLEHMIFKGTKKYSESDINTITHMLSGSCNAFTSYDYTGYLFNMPTHHWQEALEILADCMKNCTFKEDMLSSEMKAVIQELKMYRDNYTRSLGDEIISSIFADHPYHHPIIGYKQDLWSVHSENLKEFYNKHYVPNNALLVVVGDVNATGVFEVAERFFGAISADKSYAKEQHYFNRDILSKSITLYRDIKQPLVAYSFVVPGIKEKKDHLLYLLEWIIGKGKSSRLYKKLVNELQLVTSVEASAEELFDHSLFFIVYEPKQVEDIPIIEKYIKEEINALRTNGIQDAELQRALNQTKMGLYNLLENTEQQAYQLGKYYLATKDEHYLFTCFDKPFVELKQGVMDILINDFRPTFMHIGMVLPLPQEEKQTWLKLQELSDQEDARILSERIRTTPVEPPAYAQNIIIKEPGAFNFPKAQSFKADNGLKVLYYNNPNTPKINLVIEFKARPYYDPEGKQGLYNFVMRMLSEGTKKYSAQQLADIIESRGMSFNAYPGGISMSMLTKDLSFGLEILQEILTNAVFDTKEIEKIRAQLLARIKTFWDEPWMFSGQLIRENIYKDHPYSKNSLGSEDSIKKVTQKDLIDFYKKYISPDEAKIVIVGDLNEFNLQSIIENGLGKWKGPHVADLAFPALKQIKNKDINFPINRDQVVLLFAGLSVDRKHSDYDKLRLFDQIFGSGELGSMSSRLFDLREQSGLFYTINGTLIAGSDEQPGMVLVKTIVSLDRLKEAEEVIKKTIDTAADTITENEFEESKNAMINSLVNYFASNNGIANALLFIERFGFSPDFFDSRAQELKKLSIADVQQAVKKILQSKSMLTLRIGRIGNEEKKGVMLAQTK